MPTAKTNTSVRASVTLQNVELGTGATPHKSRGARVASTKPHVPPKPEEVTAAIPLLKRNPIEAFVEWNKNLICLTGKAREEDEERKRQLLDTKQDEGEQRIQAAIPKKVGMLSLFAYSTWSERGWMLLGLFFAGCAGMCFPAWLILLANALDKFSALAVASVTSEEFKDDIMKILFDQLVQLVYAFAILGCFSLVVGFAYVSLWTYTGQRQALRIKEKFVHATLRQDAEWFDLNNREELPTAIANSMVHISAALGRPMADLFANAVSSAACLAVALLLNAPLALVMLAVVPVCSVAVMIIGCFVRKRSRMASEGYVAAGALATETISGIKTVASLCAERWALTTYTKHITKGQDNSIFGGVLAGLMAGITGLLFYATYFVAFAIGTEQVQQSMQLSVIIGCFFDNTPNCRVSGADVMCCIYGVILSATFFSLMAPGLQDVNLGRQAAAKIFETIDHVPEVDVNSSAGEKLSNLQGEIVLKDTFFAYPTRPRHPIFVNFNLRIVPGSSVAFVGPSGSGKSTITKLLLRFYDISAGQLLVDGHPIDSLNLKWWRSQLGYVAQSPILFPGTIRYNIACGKPGATDEEVHAAAKAACAHEFITNNMANGYDTYFSGTSVQLSGGQMQRICIARAMIRNPSILLLDEATSALDTKSEKQVQEALENIRKQKKVTTITVAHRLTTIVNSDQIAVISNGSVAELGPHRKLLEANGIYAKLCESQGITVDTTFDSTGAVVETTSEGIEKEIPDVETGETREQAPDSVDEDDADDEPIASKLRLISLNKPEWGYLFIGIIGSGVVGALPPVEAILTAQIVANFYTVDSEDLMEANISIILWFLALGAASLLGNVMSAIGFSVSGYRLSGRMRTLVFEAMIRRPIGWFDFPEHSVGELTARLEADAEDVAKITGWALGYRVRVFASLVAAVAIALAFCWQIGLTAIMCVPIILGAGFVQKCCSRDTVENEDGLTPETLFETALRGIDALQCYDLHGDVCDDYSKALKPQARNQVKQGAIAGLVYGLSQFATFGSFAIVFFVGIVLVTSVKIGFIEFFTPVLAIMFGALGISQVNADFNAQQQGLAAAGRIFQVIDEPFDNADPFGTEGESPSSLEGAITFGSCEFGYPSRPNNLVYKGFQLSVPSKESVAFVGKSGCGKSTALQLLLRFYEVSSGAVTLDGRDVKDLNISWLRKQIGYVGQMPTLFAGTIKSNILLGNPKATEAEMIQAAKAANAHDFILQQANGYDTDIGSGGNLLSGGQKQRVAIARAIISNPKMLVLDEATAALDNQSEKIVQAALDELQTNQPRTTLVVAHKLQTVKNCDKIAVLGGGGVLELGSHSQLLENPQGLYKELWEQQGSTTGDDEKSSVNASTISC